MVTSPVTPSLFVGIDVAKEVHVARGIAADGTPFLAARKIQQSREGLERFEAELRSLATPERTLIGMEATGHYWIRLEAFLSERGWRTQVINPVITAHQARGNTRGRVTDTDDALTIAKVIRDGVKPSQILDAEHEELREMTRLRTKLIDRRVADIMQLQSQVEVMFPEFMSIMGDIAKRSSLAVLSAYPSAATMATALVDHLATMINDASMRRCDGASLAPRLQEAAVNSLACGVSSPGRERVIRQLISSIAFIDQELTDLDKIIKTSTRKPDLATKHFDRLPGFGPVTTSAAVAEFGDLKRFIFTSATGARQVDHAAMLAFAGLDPRIQSSGKWVGKPKMSKRGSPYLRRAILLAASFAIKRDDWCARLYQRYRAKCSQRGYWLALSHVARHLIQALAASLKYGDAFTWERFVEGRKALIAAA
jgi:transposase